MKINRKIRLSSLASIKGVEKIANNKTHSLLYIVSYLVVYFFFLHRELCKIGKLMEIIKILCLPGDILALTWHS